ncbi:MAG: ABC transporter substrate-binding protein [Clostridiales Family XIII bacterium]|jgi:NitT/TauT family transport system substrate-binding protein|nr:ABC transporter substrate-binding protein [Clostridiales Family XIII bacterium]
MKKQALRRLSAFFLALACAFFVAGCGTEDAAGTREASARVQTNETPPEVIRVAALKGPTAMGMVKLMRDAEDGASSQNYEFTLGVIDEIVPRITSGQADIAALPANLAAVLHNNTEGAVRVLAVNTLGVLYVVEKGEAVHSVADLAGRTILSAGKGATPEYALEYVLARNGLDPQSDLRVEYHSEAAEILPLLKQSADGIALLPQPFVVSALRNVEGLRVALDLTAEWERVSEDGSELVTGVLVVRREFAEAHPRALDAFLAAYAASTAFANEDTEGAAALIGAYGIVDAAIAREALPRCNITCVAGEEMRRMLSGYLAALYAQNPQTVGGKLPDEAFYLAP